ncbi:nascent polypeptide-associated complex protein [Candidatus Woesearchaeota archaeon]|nr:nascent polypeptide-associated complex protein [Candidatus Woesearchaeota archaeon]
MFPGMNPKQLEQAMKKLGVKQEEIEASEVIIKGKKNYIIREPTIIKMNMMGQESLQITGALELLESFTEEDIKTVAEQANVTQEKAKAMLEETRGDLAEAILRLRQEQ